ncbi:uncharacterized protein A1O5_07738 [Cladophialophora psammophila CBS 110553]|uniref:DJ-1/PfpI domain-containing protein n=1 Tax=Cladophialophora psammophila CBS 110553 TaxID=1182543 RepID=W9WKY5_9EURO|nr:uncharacterized protein A1O5_07738 [Cladophialophora psammophila CBS 110553]EXJ68807.1 hypothetical protein A1O5_07738 [Cladophialophora psammophila CBS 110553]
MAAKVIFLMADYGHDPTETAIPWKVFKDAAFDVSFATEDGNAPKCDDKMLSGWTGALLGANKAAKRAYQDLSSTCRAFQKPLAWKDAAFSLEDYDLVFLPGGHEKSVRQIMDSARVHEMLASYFPKTRKPSRKSLAAICHGVQVLAMASTSDGKSVMRDAVTTALPAYMEESIYHVTKLFLHDYYKTYGAGTDSVEEVVKKRLRDRAQFKNSKTLSPFVVEDPNYNYLSARFPPDSEALAKRAVSLVREVTQSV